MANEGNANFGQYTGPLILEALEDGRLMKLTQPFGFIDAQRKTWSVPAGAKVDGASIPRTLWTLIGGPFEGKYRHASVVHDYYCDTRTEPWKAVHRVFYEGMRASGVSEIRAKLMYAAVYFGGPDWADSTVDNNRLTRNGGLKTFSGHQPTRFHKGVAAAITTQGAATHKALTNSRSMHATPPQATLDLAQLESLIAQENPSLDDIDDALDDAAHRQASPAGVKAPALGRTLNLGSVSRDTD